MKYYNVLTDEEIKSICLCYPYKEMITGFKKCSKDFSALLPGRRPQSVSEKTGRNLIANNPHSKLTATMVEVLLSSWVPSISAIVKAQLEKGKDIDYAYIIAFSKLGGSSFVKSFFHINDEGFSEERISVICAGVAALSEEKKRIKEQKNAASTTKQVEDLKQQHKGEIKEKDKVIKEQAGEIKTISKELEEERKKVTSLLEENKQITSLRSKLSEVSSEIEQLKQNLQDKDVRQKELQDECKEIKEQKVALEQENSAIQNALTDCQKLLAQIEQKRQATLSLLYSNTLEVLRPADMDEFNEYFSNNLSSIGLDKTKPYYSLLLSFIGNTIFLNKPIICNQALGRTLAMCVSNTICGNQNPTTIPFRKGMTSETICSALETDSRMLLFDSFIGNYSEMELLPILRSVKGKIIFLTAEYDKTITLLPEEVLLSCTYINANSIPELLTLNGLNEDPSLIKEEIFFPLYEEPNSRAQRLCKEIMSELGFPSVVTDVMAEQMTSEERFDEYLAFSLIPYAIEAYGVSPYNASARLNKYAGFSGKCAHKKLLMDWYGND